MDADTLRGKCVLITGAGRRIGATIAEAVHAAGAEVVIHAHRSAAQARELASRLEARRADSTLVLAADLRDGPSLPGVVDRTLERFGRLDVLINNASSFYPTPVGSISEEQFDDLLGTNLKAPLFLAQSAAPALREARGLIINMVDIHARRPLPEHAVYCSAKAGLAMLTLSLARELAPEVRVNGIAPGTILWPEAGISDTEKQQIIERTPLRRTGAPQDIVRCVMFFACAAPFITGQIVAIDGGRSIGW